MSNKPQQKITFKERLKIRLMRFFMPIYTNKNWRGQVAEPADIKNLVIANNRIKLRLYFPEGNGPFPLMLYFHGGGFVLGDLNVCDRICRDLCVRAGMVVVSVDYCLAPEHPFPAGVDDCLAAFDWIQESSDLCRADKQAIYVVGDSAGGAMAAMLAQQRSESVAGQILIYPVLDLSVMDRPSYLDNNNEKWLTAAMMKWFRQLYFTDENDYLDVKASPLLAESLQGLAPVLMVQAEFDPLYDEGVLYVEKLKQQGVPVQQNILKGQHHGFFGALGRSPAYNEATDIILHWLAFDKSR